jgi:8-amino-7-oxononanoate synthase
VNGARPYVFSTALAPPAAAAARRAVKLVIAEPERRRRLLDLAGRLRDELGRTANGPCSAILPVIVGEAAAAVALSARLEEEGLLVPAIRPPSVAEGTARLRISLSAGHSAADVNRLVVALRGLAPESLRPVPAHP